MSEKVEKVEAFLLDYSSNLSETRFLKKGFLMFFDQLLTNYLAHLSQIRDVLAIEESSEKLHLFQPLYDAPKIKDLFTAFNPETYL